MQMTAGWADEYTVAFWIGLAVIWIFAWNRFTQPSYERFRRFEELLKILNPRDLRSGGVFVPAYFFYALMLSGLYWVLCTFGSLQLLSYLGLANLGVDAPGESVGAILPFSWSEVASFSDPERQRALIGDVTRVFEGERDIARNPSVPLAIALAIVGVIPNVRFFDKFEEKLRIIAHRLAGIPGRLIEGTRFLVENDLRPKQEPPKNGGNAPKESDFIARPNLLIKELVRIKYISEDYGENLSRIFYKIFFFKDRIVGLNVGLDWPSYSVHDAYQILSDGVAKRIGDLDTEIDGLLTFVKPLTSDPLDPAAEEQVRPRLDAIEKTARQIENDVCALLLVYAEKDGLPADKTGAGAQLRRFIKDAHEEAARDTIGFNLFVNTLVTIVLISGTFALIFGQDTARDATRQINYLLNYVVTALMTYTLAMLLALSYRQATLETTWSSLYATHWIKGAMQLLWVFLGATAVAYLSLIVWNVYITVQTLGNIVIVDRWQAVLLGALKQQWAYAILGGLFAVFIVLGIDHWEGTASDNSPATGLGPALVGALVLGAWGGGIPLITAWQNQVSPITREVVTGAAAPFVIGLLSGLVVQATLHSVHAAKSK
jgi:hypothetical protein